MKKYCPMLWKHDGGFKPRANDIDELNQDYARPDNLLYEDDQDRNKSVLFQRV